MPVNEGQIFIEGEITPQLYDDVRRQIAQNQNAESIVVHIASPGGSVYDGYKIYHALKNTGKKITSVIEGEAQSMATFISLAGSTVEIKDPSRYMIHNPSQGIKGDSEALKTGYEELMKIEDEMAKAYSEKTKLPIEQIKAMMKKTSIMSAQEARQYGFVDKVTNHLRAVAKGTPVMKHEKKVNVFNQISNLFKQVATAEATALDLQLQDGSVLTSDAQTEDTINGSNVTLAGAIAPDGDYTTVDGMVLTVAAGVVTNVVDPTDSADAIQKQIADLQAKLTAKTKVPPMPAPKMPIPAPAKTAEAPDKIAALQAQLDALKAEKESVVAEKAEVTEKVTALATQFEEFKKKTVGDDKAPDTGMVTEKKPFAIGGQFSSPSALGLQLSKHFIAQEFPWLEEHYKLRGLPTRFFHEFENSGPAMTSIVQTSFTWTYPGIFTSDLLYKPSIDTPAISDMFTIDQNIKFQKQYNLVQVLNQILKPYNGCGPTAGNSNNTRDNITSATVTTKEFRMEEAWCKDDFTQQLTGVYNNLAQEWLRTGEAQFDPAGTPIDTVIQNVLTDALRRDVFGRLTMAADQSSNANFNQFSGLWDRLIDSSGSQVNYCVIRGGSALGTGTISAANATAALEACYINAPAILKQNLAKATFWVTGSVYDAYINQLIGQGNVSQAQFENTYQGVMGNKTWDGGVPYKGIIVRPVRYWDSSLIDANNPFNATVRHLVLLTVKSNHVAGVENGNDLNKIYSWYENKDSKRYYRADMKLGYNYMHCDLQTIAY